MHFMVPDYPAAMMGAQTDGPGFSIVLYFVLTQETKYVFVFVMFVSVCSLTPVRPVFHLCPFFLLVCHPHRTQMKNIDAADPAVKLLSRYMAACRSPDDPEGLKGKMKVCASVCVDVCVLMCVCAVCAMCDAAYNCWPTPAHFKTLP